MILPLDVRGTFMEELAWKSQLWRAKRQIIVHIIEGRIIAWRAGQGLLSDRNLGRIEETLIDTTSIQLKKLSHNPLNYLFLSRHSLKTSGITGGIYRLYLAPSVSSPTA